MRSTREAILAHLRMNGPCTSDQLARAIARTPADVRYHLGRLRNEGSISALLPVPNPKQRGRPKPRYQLAAETIQNPLYQLVAALLDLDTTSEVDKATQRTGKLAAVLAPQLPQSASLSLRLNALTAALQQRGYRLTWEAHRSGPLIQIQHSPYTLLMREHPQLRDLDVQLIHHALGQDVEIIYSPAS